MVTSVAEPDAKKGSREMFDSLVAGLRAREDGAVERLVEAFGDKVYRLAMRITRSPDDAEEVTQDALWTAARKIDSFRGDSAFGSWLYRIAANTAYQKLRGRREREVEQDWDTLLPQFDEDGRHLEPIEDWSESAGELVVQSELRGKLQEAVEALPPDYRTAFLFHDVEGLSNPEIAETLGISLPAVKSRVHRSRLFLRQKLARYLEPA
ncbi:MAG TPA: sigma-70 family RNA polymerase sigma factor [Methylomirabilota bacterium]|nr:sigma-70 family RNA polymerase sigma factor [Methylomirabilota bacterium]